MHCPNTILVAEVLFADPDKYDDKIKEQLLKHIPNCSACTREYEETKEAFDNYQRMLRD